MKVSIRALIGRAMVATMLVTSASAYADQLADIKSAGKIRIGVSVDIPPYGMMDANMKLVGVDVETAQLLAADLGVAADIIHTPGAARIPNLQTKKVDIVVATLSMTPERAKVIDFSVPYMPIQTIVAAPKDIEIKSMADLVGKTVKTSRGTMMDTQLTREAKGATIVRYEDDATMITAAATGQADIIGATSQVLYVINDKKPPKPFEIKFVMTDFSAAIGMRKSEPELKGWIDNWVRTNLRNGKLNAIYKKYFNVDLPQQILDGGKS